MPTSEAVRPLSCAVDSGYLRVAPHTTTALQLATLYGDSRILAPMKLVFIHGAPGVGKLTVARELGRISGYKLFHNHLTVDLVGSVFEFGTPSFVRLREQIWLDVFREAARNDVSLIFTFAPETTVGSNFVNLACETVRSENGSLIFVELTCTEKILEVRLTDASRKGYDKLHSVEQYQTLKAAGAFAVESPPVDLSLDTTERTPADSADVIYQFIKR
ncbi:MAG: AAA family ATPase [Pyrinomonadaceae bacterium]